MGIQTELCRVLLAHLRVDVLLVAGLLGNDRVVGDSSLLALVVSFL